MSFAPRKLLRSFAFRLSLWYALIFAVSASVLLLLIYFLANSALQRKDQEIIQSKLNEYEAVYIAGGARALQSRAVKENNPSDDKSFYVNLISPQVSLSVHVTPNGWDGFNLERDWNQI